MDDAIEMRRMAPASERGRIVLEDRGHPLDRRVAAEGGTAREHLVEHCAEREDVGAVIGGFATHLFRRHVAGRSQHVAGAGRGRGAECVTVAFWAEPLSLARPKSRILARPSAVTKMLSGFRSR